MNTKRQTWGTCSMYTIRSLLLWLGGSRGRKLISGGKSNKLKISKKKKNLNCAKISHFDKFPFFKYLSKIYRGGITVSVAYPLGWQGGQSATPDSEKIAKNREKSQEKSGKNQENRKEKAKIGKFLSLCPSWQIGLATLLHRMGCW